ncbi:hypothetical protein [uncultured Aquitalea sp.]|uniref:hypothetical protein n=1 Tax=uncultured Aquitalea sp. TaxID=540272 RepID=UPI0025E0925A|nr:hypothetical protein [uncultured Aquitalea sp.]
MRDIITYSSAASFAQLQAKIHNIVGQCRDEPLRRLCQGAVERIFSVKAMLCMPFDMVYSSQAARLDAEMGPAAFAEFARSEDGLSHMEYELHRVFDFIERQHGHVVFERLNGLAAALAWDIIEALMRDFIEQSCNRYPLYLLDALDKLKPIHRNKLFRSEVMQRHQFSVHEKLGTILLEENNIRGIDRLRLWSKLLFPEEALLLAFLEDPVLDTLQRRRDALIHTRQQQEGALAVGRDEVNLAVIRAVKLCVMLSMDVSVGKAPTLTEDSAELLL